MSPPGPARPASGPPGWRRRRRARRAGPGERLAPSWRSRPGRLAGGGDLDAERLQRVDVDLREGGEGLDDIAQHRQRHAGANGQRGLLQPLPGLRAERVGPAWTPTVSRPAGTPRPPPPAPTR